MVEIAGTTNIIMSELLEEEQRGQNSVALCLSNRHLEAFLENRPRPVSPKYIDYGLLWYIEDIMT